MPRSASVLTIETPSESRAIPGTETTATTRFPAADTVATTRYVAPDAPPAAAPLPAKPLSAAQPAVPVAAPPPRNLSDVVTRIARAAIALSEVAPELANLAHDMEQGAARQAEQAQAIAAASARMTADLSAAGERLQGCSKDIGSLVGVIRRIADQTRLLSLNASIEAARAGAAGRTFAIIAGEVQALAEGTAKATRQVDGTVATIASNVAMTVAAVGSAKGSANSPAGDARDLHGINEQVQAIADIAYEHSAGACQVTAASQRLRAWTDDLLVAVGCFRLDAHQRATDAFTDIVGHVEVRSLNRPRQEEHLRAALNQYPFFELLYITDLRGRQVVDNIAPAGFQAAYGTSGLGMDWSQRTWFQAAVGNGAGGRLYLSDMYRSAATGNFCFTIAGVLCGRDGAPAGVLGADVSFTRLL
jgi:hypothetical protein